MNEALELRSAGRTFEDIGAALGVTKGCAYKLVRAAIAAIPAQAAAHQRTLELLRLDRLHVAVWPRAIEGDLEAVDRVLSVMKRRTTLLGLDAPKSDTAVQIRMGEELSDAIARLRAALEPSVFAEVLHVLASEAPAGAAHAEAGDRRH